LANVGKGLTVLIIGSGVSGILHIQLAKLRGVAKVFATDINEYRLKMAKKFGADEAFYASEDIPSKLMELNDHRLAEYVLLKSVVTIKGLKDVTSATSFRVNLLIIFRYP
ncbi:unnamed protein product, partial [marine sediment metagenome]